MQRPAHRPRLEPSPAERAGDLARLRLRRDAHGEFGRRTDLRLDAAQPADQFLHGRASDRLQVVPAQAPREGRGHVSAGTFIAAVSRIVCAHQLHQSISRDSVRSPAYPRARHGIRRISPPAALIGSGTRASTPPALRSTFALIVAVSLLAPTGVAAAPRPDHEHVALGQLGRLHHRWRSVHQHHRPVDRAERVVVADRLFRRVIGVDGATNHSLIQVGTDRILFRPNALRSVVGDPARERRRDHLVPHSTGRTGSRRRSDASRRTAGELASPRRAAAISRRRARIRAGAWPNGSWRRRSSTTGSRSSRATRRRVRPRDGERPKSELTADDSGALVQSRRRVAVPSVPDVQGDGLTVTRQ